MPQTQVEFCLMEANDETLRQWRKERYLPPTFAVIPPETYKKAYLSDEEYARANTAWGRACADIVICTRLPDGRPAVLTSRRPNDVSFPNKWWVYGGAVAPFQGYATSAVARAAKECGVMPEVESIIGVYSTCWPEPPFTATIQPCFVGSVPYEMARKASTDEQHTAFRLLALEDLETLPPEEWHEYPMWVFRRALRTMPD